MQRMMIQNVRTLKARDSSSKDLQLSSLCASCQSRVVVMLLMLVFVPYRVTCCTLVAHLLHTFRAALRCMFWSRWLGQYPLSCLDEIASARMQQAFQKGWPQGVCTADRSLAASARLSKAVLKVCSQGVCMLSTADRRLAASASLEKAVLKVCSQGTCMVSTADRSLLPLQAYTKQS